MTEIEPSTIEFTNGATAISADEGGYINILTGAAQWSYSVVFPRVQGAPDEVLASLELEVTRGAIGLLAINWDGVSSSDEIIVGEGRGRRTIDLVLKAGSGDRLCVRNVDCRQSQVRVFSYQTSVRRPVNIDVVLDTLLPKFLLTPGLEAKKEVAKIHGIKPSEISKFVTSRSSIVLDLEKIFADDLGQLLLREYRHQCSLLPSYDFTKMDAHAGYGGPDYTALYFRQSITRIYHLVKSLRKFGFEKGSVLEIGSLFGTFAGVLQKLGYQVTAIDRYRKFGGALDGYIRDLRRSGVEVVETDAEGENSVIEQFSNFDVVISMAVIEHIPHTPRHFLESLVNRARLGGMLALDTPNIAQLWHRKRAQAGKSIHPDINNQFYSKIPFEGHHREYTAAEMCWMLEQIGCIDIRCELFDYNLFQFEELSYDHITSFLEIAADPNLADTVLVTGRVHRDNGEVVK